MKARYFLVLLFLWQSISFCQVIPIALLSKKVTSFSVVNNNYEHLLIAGTEFYGMYFHFFDDNDSVWTQAFINNRSLSYIYAQPVSPYLTKLFMATIPDSSNYNTLLYTNLMPIQSAIPSEDSGLDKSKIKIIKSIAGFNFTTEDSVMPAYCCTNDPNIYINKNRIWEVSHAGTETVTLNFVYTNDSTIWAGGFNNGAFGSALLLKSTDYGKTWDNIPLPIGEIFSCYSFYTSLDNSDINYIGLNENILKSSDKGKTWNAVLSNIKDVIFTSIVENPLKPDQVFAGGRTSDNAFVMYKSIDGGENWKQVILTCYCIIKGINDMHGVVKDNQFIIYIATDGDGIWKYTDKITGILKDTKLDYNYILYQNYPNPFNPNTRISFEIPDNGKVSLIIYDIIGREVTTILKGIYKNVGTHSILWNSKNSSGFSVPSGIYICKLVCGDHTRMIKMVLTK